jgi:transcriptional regulator GlxA family with amidase domain
LQAYAFLLEWWWEIAHPSGSAEDRLARALRYSREHFREPMGVKQLASEAGMSREHFSRIFLARTGETPSVYLQRLRMNEATVLVQDTDLPLREIAMRSGFYSERHLLRTFQRVHGVSPSRYRRKKSLGDVTRRRKASGILD